MKFVVCDYSKYFDVDAIGEVKLPLDDVEPDHVTKSTLPLAPSITVSYIAHSILFIYLFVFLFMPHICKFRQTKNVDICNGVENT